MSSRRESLRMLAALATAPLWSRAMAADAYPTKAIRVVVTYGAGGTADITARVTSPKLAERLGQPVVVENKLGAGGALGTELAARAEPDGYTLYQGSIAPLAILPALGNKLGYDPLHDFEPIALQATLPLVLAVNPSVPAKTVQELIEYAKAKPGVLNFGSSGNGSSTHLSGELFKSMAGVNIVHVPFKGSAESANAVLGGEVQMMFADSSALALINSGRLRALAVTSGKRTAIAPTIPTMSEAGLPGYESYAWLGLLAPAKTPRAIVERIATESAVIMKVKSVQDALLARGIEPVTDSNPESFKSYIRAEHDKWGQIIRSAGIKAG
ncbi:MAG TPA: tripartite tricarboxylate transporter substrate binding protein [Casimicrobiaceae bacterium]|nr:tripartite tricarboxylate transporter substrate binding protein [Casimicrobiaceae bacterium]